jgi:hypothetical protein
MIDEIAKRKENFSERDAAAVVLADGQSWYVPKPWLEIRPVFRNGHAAYSYSVLTCGPRLDALVEAIGGIDNDDEILIAGVATLAAYLLKWHYDLDDRELDHLLAFRVGDPDSLAWVRQVVAIATGGSGPKVSCAGDD